MHEPCGYALTLVCSFDLREKNTIFTEEEIVLKGFGSDLKDLRTKIINYEQKEMTPLTDKENKFYEEQKECYILANRVLL